MAFWNNTRVLVTGGASFIGSRLVEKLVAAGATVRVADNLSSGKLAHIQPLIDGGSVEFMQADLRDSAKAARALAGREVVFHLAADHGGRGYLHLHQAGPASNLLLDGLVFYEALKAGVDKIVYASSGCVYPNSLQMDPEETLYLTEELVRPPYDADNIYGWAKLMAEDTLRAYHREHGLKSASCRYFTAYGPRGLENHAVIAMIARAFVRQNPFEVWGDGTQVRNWTHVDDIVQGTLLAAERIDDGTGVNIGTMERTRVIDAAREVIRYTGYEADIKLLPDMPTGPLNRVADNSLARKLLGWRPGIAFIDGLHQTMDWYFETRRREDVERALASELTER
ncbi:MAG: NAD-dependent epimerase/dehydratase family protein [Xanthomonadales bacterium]|nr:NAD-dependent epimerase/dehydratase family protein [Xanthomonadales bacterium]